MRQSRPYRIWCREVSNVSKEVFWIFLHHLNVIPLPRSLELEQFLAQNDECDAPDQQRGSNGANDSEAKLLQRTYTTRHFLTLRAPVPAAPYIGGVEWDATLYITAHLDLLNGLVASLPSGSDRNDLREQLRVSGWEKLMGGTLRTCKEKFYGGVHDGLRGWVAAALEDEWATDFVRQGPTREELMAGGLASPRKSPVKEEPPQIELSRLEDDGRMGSMRFGGGEGVNEDDGWLL